MISDTAVVKSKKIGHGTTIREFVVVAETAIIGARCIIHPFVLIEGGVEIGDDVEIFSGVVLGKEPKGASAVARVPTCDKQVTIGNGCSIGPNAVIFQDVKIGTGCLIGDGASIRENCRIGDACLIGRYVTLNYNVRVGNRSKVMDLTHLTGNMTVGDDVFISIHVSTTNDNNLGKLGYDKERVLGPTIANEAMIGAGASILPGVSIGCGSVVASGAVVTKDVADETLVAGVPARFVRLV